MSNYSIDQLTQCVRREIAYRKRVYHRLVNEGKMEPTQAVTEIEMMQAILEHLDHQQQLNLFPSQ